MCSRVNVRYRNQVHGFRSGLAVDRAHPPDGLHHLLLQELCLQRARSLDVRCACWVPNGSCCNTCLKRVIAAAVGWLSIDYAAITKSLPAACVMSSGLSVPPRTSTNGSVVCGHDRLLLVGVVKGRQSRLRLLRLHRLLNRARDTQIESLLTQPRFPAPSVASGSLRAQLLCNRYCRHSKPEPGSIDRKYFEPRQSGR